MSPRSSDQFVLPYQCILKRCHRCGHPRFLADIVDDRFLAVAGINRHHIGRVVGNLRSILIAKGKESSFLELRQKLVDRLWIYGCLVSAGDPDTTFCRVCAMNIRSIIEVEMWRCFKNHATASCDRDLVIWTRPKAGSPLETDYKLFLVHIGKGSAQEMASA